MRTTCVDEMFGTLAIASSAAYVRSGIPATVAVTLRPDGSAGFACAEGAAGACATASSAVRIRPVRTRPATKPKTTKSVAMVKRLSMVCNRMATGGVPRPGYWT